MSVTPAAAVAVTLKAGASVSPIAAVREVGLLARVSGVFTARAAGLEVVVTWVLETATV